MKTAIFAMMLVSGFNVSAAFAPASAISDKPSLLERLKAGVVETLYYGEKDFSASIKEIIVSRDNEDQLISTYRSLDNDQVNLKHTILIVMIKKQQNNSYKFDGFEKTKAVLVGALTDEHDWIRTEAVWGLRFFGDSSLMRRIAPLVDDKSDSVRKEAQDTLVELYELYQDRTDNIF